jgi:hypothetical protein
MSGIVGPKGHYPCPICLVPKHEQPNVSHSWPQRTLESTFALYNEASHQKTKQASKDILHTQSLRQIDVSTAFVDAIVIASTYKCISQNTFLIFFAAFFSLFQAFVLDPLHAIEQGEHGRHLWPWLVKSLLQSSLEEIDSWYV